MNSLPCTKDLASSQGFDVGILYDSYKSFLHQRSGFKAGSLMSVYNQTYEQSSINQRPGFKSGF